MQANGQSSANASSRSCFVVSAFGSTADDQRRYKQVLRHLVQKVLTPNFRVIRADEIDDEGLITNQIIEHLLEDDLVVADLTDLNPNVFYEVAVRHAARKPIVHLITKGQDIPFDVANMRAIPYALDDPDALEEAQDELLRKVKAIEANDWKAAPNPISSARDVWLLQESEQPDIREAGELLASFRELRDEVHSLGRRVRALPDEPPRMSLGVKKLVVDAVTASDPTTEEALAERLPLTREGVRTIVASLLESEDLYLVNGKLSTIPF